MEGNFFENDFGGIENGFRQHSNTSRPNQEALEGKRDEYLSETVNDVVKKFDQKKIDLIAKFIDDIGKSRKARVFLKELTDSIRDRLIKDHKINILEVSPSGAMDYRDKQIVDAIDELDATYPDDIIEAHIKATLELGYR